MSIKMTERDLEALRAGITEQVARETRQEEWQRSREREVAKPHVAHAVVIQASQLRVGDVVCSTTGMRSFKAEFTVRNLQHASTTRITLREGTLWMSYDHGGSALHLDDPVLVQVPRPEPLTS